MSLRDLPSVDKLLAQADDLIAEYGRPLTTEIFREKLDEARTDFRAQAVTPSATDLLAQARARLASLSVTSLRPVINASGVILHTNLGRAPLSRAALTQMEAVARGYSTLEYDLSTGERGSRAVHAESLLTRLTGAEAALVVNNNAAAVLLILSALAQRKGVLISRTQLVEIGGGFRVPDVMKQSGAKLIEVGTTNRTHLKDYKEAIDEKTALILRAHHSNFKIIGFATEPTLAELCSLGLPVVDDLGSGALLDTAAFGLGHEPMVQESLKAGAAGASPSPARRRSPEGGTVARHLSPRAERVGDDGVPGAALVAFSGDKLLGGPQAGIIVGRADLIAKLKKHPLARAVRADKLCLAALSATLLHYLHDEATREIPIWRMIALPLAEIEKRAQAWATQFGAAGASLSPRAERVGDDGTLGAVASVIEGESTVGGGSLPGETLPTKLVALAVKSPNLFAARLRAADPPIVARVLEDKVMLDPRTVLVEEEALLIKGVLEVLTR